MQKSYGGKCESVAISGGGKLIDGITNNLLLLATIKTSNLVANRTF